MANIKFVDRTANRPAGDVAAQSPVSRIARRTRGQSHGPITRLMSPSDFGHLLKPFVFLDLIDDRGKPFSGFGLHQHSGIATLTYIAEGSVRYEDTNGATGLLPAGGIEWTRAGGGVWHGGGMGTQDGRAASSSGLPYRPSSNSEHRDRDLHCRCASLLLCGFDVETVEIHHLAPGVHEVLREAHLPIG